jgi:hypothetical protein
MIAALTYNLRKNIKFSRLKTIDKAAEMLVKIERHFQLFYARFMSSIAPFGCTPF